MTGEVRVVKAPGARGRGVPAGGLPGQVVVRGVGPDGTTEWATVEGVGEVTQVELDAEATARGDADADLATDLATETAARIAADSSEATTRAGADTTNATAITTEATARAAAVTAEATARGAGDTAVTALVTAEAARAAAAEALLIPLAQKGAANGVASLGPDSKIPSAQIPSLAISDVFVVASQAAMLALSTAGIGDVAKRTDLGGQAFILSTASYSTLADWISIGTGTGVSSVDSLTGDVVLSSTYATLASLATTAAGLTAEITARGAADTTLQSNITAEAATRAAADTANAAAITAEVTARGTAVSGEAAARVAADTTLQTNITAEATTRAAALVTEATARTTAIGVEASARVAADAVLAAADAALDVRVDALEGASPVANGGGGAMLVAASDAHATVITRADYVCDGTADEVQINLALATGGKVVLSDGTFVTNAPIKVEEWGQELEGSGVRYTGSAFGGASTAGTLIRPSASFTGAAVVKVEKDSNNYIVGMAHVHGFSIDGQLETVETYDGILFRSFRGSLHDVDVQHCTQDGIRVVGNETPNGSWATYDTRIYSINCSNNGRYGLHLVDNSAQDTHISQAILEDNLTGLYLGGASHQIVSMHSYGNTQYGVLSDTGGGARTKFIGCKIEHSGRHGVYFNGSTNPVQVQFVGTNFSSNGETTTNTYDHISVATGSANLLVVSGCTFATTDGATNIARYCINIGALAPNTSITGNTIDDGAFATGALNYTVNGGTTEATLKCYGNQEIQDFSGSGLVTLAAGGQAGTSAPAPQRGTNARNSKGTLTFGTGSGPTAGIMVTVTFDTAEIARPGNTVTSQFWVNPLNAATAALNPYVIPTLTGTTTTGFTISFASAPAASQANTVYSVSWGMVR